MLKTSWSKCAKALYWHIQNWRLTRLIKSFHVNKNTKTWLSSVVVVVVTNLHMQALSVEVCSMLLYVAMYLHHHHKSKSIKPYNKWRQTKVC